MTAVDHPAGAGAEPARPGGRCGAGCSPRCCRWSLIGAVFFWFLPQFTSVADVWTSVQAMSWVEVAILLLARDLEPGRPTSS